MSPPRPKELAMLFSDELNAWLTAAFPDRPGWSIRDHQPVQSFQQQMDRVTLCWPATGATAELFVRVYRSYLSWWTLITWDLPQREHTAWDVAHRHGVPVAPTLYRGSAAGMPGVVIGRVPGATGWAPQSSTLVKQLANTLAQLHGATIRADDHVHLPDCTLPALLARLATWADEVEAAQLRNDLNDVAARLAHIEERPASLVHGDCHPGNILVDGETLTAIIDWEEAALGDPRIDVCWLDHAIRRHDAALADQFLYVYQERAGYMVGDLDIWAEFLEVRYQIIHAWLKHAIAHQRPLPSANPEAWPD
jgi:aminoglycoside phosphotransferase (APT) family kinase protein